MAAIDELLNLITDENLRTRLSAEIVRLKENTQFGLVWEKHLPENAQLTGFKIRVGSTVAVRGESTKDSKTMTVLSIDKKKGKALCRFETKDLKGNAETKEQVFAIADLVVVARCGEPIFPTLRPIDKVENAPDSSLWHTLIQADNYHALQLLAYLYPGQVDCIYIDPPYNTGAKDWKYNNDYVDSNDKYRHSKWLSMMENRLKIAKRLLNPANSVLIVTIDEKEYLHLGCLLEQIFPEATIQMISSVINPGGVSRGAFRRTDEYIFFVMIGKSLPSQFELGSEWFGGEKTKHIKDLNWRSFARAGSNSDRVKRPKLFYPIFVKDGKIESVGEVHYGCRYDISSSDPNVTIVWPLHKDGTEACWQYNPEGLRNLIKDGFLKVGGKTQNGYALYYLNKGEQGKIKAGVFEIVGRDSVDGSVITKTIASDQAAMAPTQWHIPNHNARTGGTEILKKLGLTSRFSYPKSLYAVHDVLRFFVAHKKDSLIVDFFAGSGTTLHAINLLNAEDGGHRRCIMVTNNEVGEAEAKEMRSRGLKPGDEEWEARGIAQYVTWPRTVCSIKGVDVNGQPINGAYIGSERPMSDGFDANCEFFRLDFLDKNEVAFGRAFREILPLLWLKAGAKGERPEISSDADIPEMLVLPHNNFAVLTDEDYFPTFRNLVADNSEIEHVFIVTDSNKGFQEMALELPGHITYQLYRDYLDNFRINLNDTTSL